MPILFSKELLSPSKEEVKGQRALDGSPFPSPDRSGRNANLPSVPFIALNAPLSSPGAVATLPGVASPARGHVHSPDVSASSGGERSRIERPAPSAEAVDLNIDMLSIHFVISLGVQGSGAGLFSAPKRQMGIFFAGNGLYSGGGQTNRRLLSA